MDYIEYSYLWPPRPGSGRAIPKELLAIYQAKGWIAQLKKNGTCTVVFSRGDEVIFKTRHPELHNGDHKMWKPSALHTAPFKGSPFWNVYVGELLNNKVTNGTKDTLYLFDKLVHNGNRLNGVPFIERYNLLKGVTTNEKVLVAENFEGNFKQLMANLGVDDEGLVLKDPNAPLQTCKENSNQGWQVKCRKPHTNYKF